MNDEHLRHLPQPPTADIVRLAPERLAGLLGDSLSPAQARVAIAMLRGGRDAQAIAERVQASVVAVKAFQHSLKPARAAAAPPAAAPTEPAPAPTEQLEAAPPAKPAPTATPKPPPIPDVELTGLQQTVVRRLRKAHIPTSVIALAMRLTPDQVMRVAGEIP